MAKLSVLILTALMPAAMWAQQTLTLRDGSQLSGRLISAGDHTVTFHINNGDTRTFDYDRVQSIAFNGERRDYDRDADRGAAYPGGGNTYANTNPGYPPPPPPPGQYRGIMIPAGTTVSVRTNEPIDSRSVTNTTYSAQVNQDVADANGNVVIPAGSEARLVVRQFRNSELGLDLQSIRVNERRYYVNTNRLTAGQPGVGANGRTGAFVGGGAALGTLLGAIAGGGKGAAIGALAGAGAGASAEVLTRGDHVHVPAETVLNFRLENNLQLNPGQ